MPAERRLHWGWLVAAAYLLLGLAAWGASWWRADRDLDRFVAVQRLHDDIARIAGPEGLEIALVQAVVLVESGGRPAVRSHRDAVGLMQLRSIAVADVQRLRSDIGDGDLTDPAYNLLVGSAYLRAQLQRFKQDEILALAAYNCGPTKVAALRRAYPSLQSSLLIDTHAPKETRAYYRKVLAARERFRVAPVPASP